MEYQENTNQPNISMYEESSDLSHNQGTSFKTSFLGFDKEDVISYIDGLVRDVSEQKDHLESSLNRLTDQNRDLIERVNRYEQRIHMVQQELDDEKLYNQNAHEREELFKKAIAALQEKVAFLQNNTVSPTGGTDAVYEEQTKRANEIVLRLREEILRKDENISRLSEELSRRNDIILNQDKILAAKGQQVLDQTKSLEEQKLQILSRTDELHRLTEQVASLKSRIELLEQKRNEVIAELDNTRAKLQAAISQQQKDREEMERVQNLRMSERDAMERYREQQAAVRDEIGRVRAQQQAAYEEIERIKQQQQTEREAVEQVRRQQQQEGQRLMQMQQTIRRQADLVEQAKSKLANESAALERAKEQIKVQTEMLEQRIKRQQEYQIESKRREEARVEQRNAYQTSEPRPAYDIGYGTQQTMPYLSSYDDGRKYESNAVSAYEKNNSDLGLDFLNERRQYPAETSRMGETSRYEQLRAYTESKNLGDTFSDTAYGYGKYDYETDVRAYSPDEFRKGQMSAARPDRMDEPVSYYRTPSNSSEKSRYYEAYGDAALPQQNTQDYANRDDRRDGAGTYYRSE